MRTRSRQTGRAVTPDILDQARANLGAGADPVTVADSLFDAALRALAAVPEFHPEKWAMVTRHYQKMGELYERIVDRAGGTAGGLAIIREREGEPGKGVGDDYKRGYNASHEAPRPG